MASNASSPPETPRLEPVKPAPSEEAGNNHIHGVPPPPLQRSMFAPRHRTPSPRHLPYSDRCFSLGMSRVYDNTLRCDKCRHSSDFGWFYRCTNETETRLYESIRDGNIEHFDETGEMFSQQVKQPTGGPAARADKLSLLKELKPEQIESLSAPQLAKLLKQRESANATALNDRYGFLAPGPEDRPYLTGERQECKNTLCPHCGKGMVGEEIALLDLDGILKGNIPPTVAVGYCFRKHGRPVADADIVRNIGLRQVPESKSEASKFAQRNSTEITGSIGPKDDDEDETTLHTNGPLTPSDTFITTRDSNEDLLQLYTDEDFNNMLREDGRDQFL
ncbi:hypothetical protein VP1G_04315 [Cytospora mali]|uniref:Uncharacterized protein n=1 Tax=Cytospora mali TaxID=578113 RepID=A0A194UYZ3_CYTMA|nr:hypothetical protein VP1G_04315 [Valsa mali var. pyri (nom. inval.)]